MSKLTEDEIKHIAKLANLKLSEDEVKQFQKQLSDILGYVSELSSVNVEDAKEASRSTSLNNVFGKDLPEPSIPQESALSGSERLINNYFVVSALLLERGEK